MKTLRTKFFRAKAEKCPPPPTGKAVQSNKSNSLRVGMVDKSSTKRKLTRREQRDLDIEITFMEGLLQRDPKCIEALSVLSDDYSRRGKVTEGLKADVRLARIRPNDPAVLYNLACRYSLAKNVEESIAMLRRAITKGFKDFKWVMRDPDLVNARKDPRFRKVWAKIISVQPER